MGFLGFDDDRLGILRHALERASADLVAAHVPADAADAFAAVTSSIRAMTTWSRRIRSLIDNPELTMAALPPAPIRLDLDPMFRLAGADAPRLRARYGTAAIDSGDVADALLSDRQQHGWTIVTDPTPEVAPTAQEQSMHDSALAVRLRDDDATDLLAGPGGAEIRRRMTDIAHDTRRSRDFIAALDDQGLAELADDAARRWHDNAGPSGDQHARDRAIADLGLFADIIDCGRASRSTPVPAALSTMDPQAAAMMLSQLDVDGALLGDLTAATLARWYTGPPPGHAPWITSIDADVLVGPGAILLPQVASAAGAPTAFVQAAIHLDGDTRVFVLYGSDPDPVTYHAIMSTSTDPTYISLDEAESTLRTVASDYPGYGASPTSTDNRVDGSVLGDMLAPWLGDIAGELPDKPGFTASDRSRVIAEALRDHRSRATIEAALGSIVRSTYRQAARATGPGAWTEAMVQFGTLSALRGMIGGAADKDDLDKQARNDLNNQFWTGNGTNVASTVAGVIPVVGNLLGIGVNAAGSVASGSVISVGPIELAQDQAMALDTVRDFDAYSMVAAVFSAAIGRGEIPERTEPPPEPPTTGTCTQVEYQESLTRWIAGVPAGPTRDHMLEVVGQGLDRRSAEEHCALASN